MAPSAGVVMLALLLAAAVGPGPIAQSVERAAGDPAIREAALARRVYELELRADVVRDIADWTAVDLAADAADLGSTGWAIARGGAEGNPLLGGSRNAALIIVAGKAAAAAVVYAVRRKKMREYQACMLANYDGGAHLPCGQREAARKATLWNALGRVALTVNNVVVALRGREESQ